MTPILSITDATKRYKTPDGGTITALNNISLTVEQNEFVTLLGPSGCGKTTLLRAVSGFEDLESGSIEIEGARVTHLPAHKRPVNTVFQKYALFPHLTISKNVAYSLEVAGVERAEIKQRVGEILGLVGLNGFEDRKINQLSGGQQQRVALARSLVARPKILLLDEPLSALDKNLRHKMQQELKTLQEEIGISFVFVTHDQEEALTMSDRIVVLCGGKIQQLGAPEDLYRRPENEFVARFVGESNLLEATVTGTKSTSVDVTLLTGQKITISAEGLTVGQKIKLLARPEDVSVGKGNNKNDLTFNGRVGHVSFVGSDYQLQIFVNDSISMKASIRPCADQRIVMPQIGSDITLNIKQNAFHVITQERVV